MIKFVKNDPKISSIYSEDSNEPSQTENELIPVPRRQRLMKDFRIIELLMDILYYPFFKATNEKASLFSLKKIREMNEYFH